MRHPLGLVTTLFDNLELQKRIIDDVSVRTVIGKFGQIVLGKPLSFARVSPEGEGMVQLAQVQIQSINTSPRTAPWRATSGREQL